MTSSSLAAAISGGVTACWTAMAYVVNRLARPTPALWRSPGGRRVLVVAAHPDDEIGCGGALLLHVGAGDHVSILHVTDGRGSRADGLGPAEMAERRRAEAASVARTLGVVHADWLGLPEWAWDEPALVAALREHLDGVAPDVVYAPSRVDFHPEHVRVARCVARALGALPSLRPAVRVYEMQVPLTPVLVNLVAPIHAVAAGLWDAIRGYQTQRGSLERCRRMKRYAAACHGLRGYAEPFWELEAAAYVRLHPPGGGDTDGAFRGVRRWPFSDPLAYLRGLATRRRLRRLALRPDRLSA